MIRVFLIENVAIWGKICRFDTEKKKKKTGSIASLVCTYDFIVGVSQ